MHYVHSQQFPNSRQVLGPVTTSSVVKASFFQPIAMLTANGSNMEEYVRVEQSGVCGGEH
jgi:hypothetical protein